MRGGGVVECKHRMKANKNKQNLNSKAIREAGYTLCTNGGESEIRPHSCPACGRLPAGSFAGRKNKGPHSWPFDLSPKTASPVECPRTRFVGIRQANRRRMAGLTLFANGDSSPFANSV